MWKNNSKSVLLFLLISGISYFFLGYVTTQDNFIFNISFYALAFASFLGIVVLKDTISTKTLLISSVLVHGVFLLSIPTLSPDVYRFLWDGELITLGIHPYMFTPNELVQAGNIEMTPYLKELYANITDLSRSNYSLYPSVNQVYFLIPAWLTDNLLVAIVIMRLLMMGTFFVGVYFIRKTLVLLNSSEKQVFLFALNPLVIVEATGNLHFEAVMFSFLAIAIYFILQNKWVLGAVIFACAVNIKLTPLLLLPFFLNYLGWMKSIKFYLTTLVASGLIMVVFLWPSVFSNFMQSITLYFNNFEFNSSAYRLSAYLLHPIFSYDTALIVGPSLSKLALVVIIALSLFSLRKKKETLFLFMLFGYVLYLLLATTIHPWYLIIPLGLSIYTTYRFMLYWSFIVMMSYSFYALGESTLVNGLISIEYIGLLLWIIFEVKKKRSVRTSLH